VSKKGLPVQMRMRHDSHFVDTLSEQFGASLGKFLSITDIETNPQQPRQTVGDLRELKASIESKGVLEPILVRPVEKGKFQIISGERRFRAAIEAGLAEIPCIVLDVPENEVLEIALIENLHRKDLTPFEEAEGYRALMDRFGYTHQKIADTVGRSRVTVTESLALLAIPEELRRQCRHADITSKTMLVEIARADGPERMKQIIEAIARGATRRTIRDEKREGREQDGGARRVRPFRLVYAPKDSQFRLNLAFRRSRVGREDVVSALRKLIEEIQSGRLELKGKG
jgi:ParB family chromosome partitioning protein